jgi:zinc transporter ZupT
VTLSFYKILAAVMIFLVTIVIVLYPLIKKNNLKQLESVELGEALASGIFLGAAFFHMLPDAIRIFSRIYGNNTFPTPEVICVSGFLFLLFLERLSLIYSTFQAKNTAPYILTSILIIHALVEGAALGIGTTFTETLMLFIAISAHKGSESFALCVTLIKHQLSFSQILKIIIFFALMTPLGIGLGSLVNHTIIPQSEMIAALFNAFAAGTFLYISTLHHIHFHKHTQETQGLLEFASLVTGAVIMGIIAIWN